MGVVSEGGDDTTAADVNAKMVRNGKNGPWAAPWPGGLRRLAGEPIGAAGRSRGRLLTPCPPFVPTLGTESIYRQPDT